MFVATSPQAPILVVFRVSRVRLSFDDPYREIDSRTINALTMVS